MKPRTIRILAVGVAGLALVWGWYLLTREPGAAPRRAAKLLDRAVRRATHPPAADVPWPAAGTPEFNDRARAKGLAWLNARGRDATGLVALWDLTHDDALLDEAAGRFPHDLRVCMAMMERLRGDPGAALPWIEKIIAAEPENPEGHYLLSWARNQSGDRVGALAALRAATRIGFPRENHRPQRAATLQEAMTASGLSARESAFASLSFYQNNDVLRLCLASNGQLVRETIDQLTSAGDAEQSGATGRTGLASVLNAGLRRNGPLMLADEAAANSLVRSILNRLPDDWSFAPQSLTALEWKQHAMKECVRIDQERRAAQPVPQRIKPAPDDVVVEYVRLFLAEGENAAATWLLQQPVAQIR